MRRRLGIAILFQYSFDMVRICAMVVVILCCAMVVAMLEFEV